jgi:hypothetical protein
MATCYQNIIGQMAQLIQPLPADYYLSQVIANQTNNANDI